MLFSVESAANVEGARIELRRYDFPRPNAMVEVDDAPIFSMVLPRPEGTSGKVHFEGLPSAYEIGPRLLRPAGIRMFSSGDGGVLRILTCRFDRSHFATVTGLKDWDARRLQLCTTLNSRNISRTAGRLYTETVNPGFASDLAKESLVQLLLIEIGRIFQEQTESPRVKGGLSPWQLSRIDDILMRANGFWPTTAELARQCGISRSHLSRAFSESSYTSLATYAAALRVERAKALMQDGGISMAEIARILGFATPSVFGAAFRRITGYTPRQFARTLSANS
jgi:AraC family transcriptional regulator